MTCLVDIDIVIEFGSVSMLRCCVLFSSVCVVSCRVAFFLAVPLRNVWSLGSGRHEAHTRASRLQPCMVVFLDRSLILPA